MTVFEVTDEQKKMSNGDRLQVIETATQLLREDLNGASHNAEAELRRQLRRSAEIMAEEYENNKELTGVTSALEYEHFADE